MAEVTRTPTIPPVAYADRDNRQPGPGQPGPGSDEQSEEAEQRKRRRRVEDVTFIMGIPAAEVTPAVQEALDIIVAEFDRVRGEFERSRDRLHHLQERMDRHSFLPVLARPAFMRELGRILERCRRAETTSTLVCLHFGNLAAVRRATSRSVAERALVTGVEAAIGHLRATDVAGSLGGADLGVILALAERKDGEEKAAEIAAAAGNAIRALALPARVRISWGLHEFGHEAVAEQVLDVADRDLWRRSPEV